ncbi:MAG: type II toxin-antitoxin system RelE/ParE family toxin [Candidatus Hydrogenedentes bacterium]|nr:type II toxin-antitoxin system RelE/ParE family toxin [Candidatus Hydrogenedentota bacterium]
MRGNITRTVQADEDLIEIWSYIARDNMDAADALIDNIETKVKLLADNPRIGAARDEIAKGLRLFTLGNYALLYREIPGGIELVRVVHGARNLPGLFSS